MKSFLNYFASKTVLLNILQNVVIHLLKYFVLCIETISQNDTYSTGRIKFPCVV